MAVIVIVKEMKDHYCHIPELLEGQQVKDNGKITELYDKLRLEKEKKKK